MNKTSLGLLRSAEYRRLGDSNLWKALLEARTACAILGRASLKAASPLLLLFGMQLSIVTLARAESPQMVGSWKVEITFANGESRSLQFDAQAGGKGSFLLLDPRLKAYGPGKPSEAKWSLAEGNAVIFSGKVEFPLGNVGRDPGTLILKGKLETDSSIAGDVDFSPVAERPSKHGTFKAARAGGH
jgi:hypothetical protein